MILSKYIHAARGLSSGLSGCMHLEGLTCGDFTVVRTFVSKRKKVPVTRFKFKHKDLRWVFGRDKSPPRKFVPMEERVVLGSSGYPWKFASSVIFERGPIVLPEPDPIEVMYEEHKFQHYNRFAVRRDYRVDPQTEMEKDSFKASQKRGELFVPAPRITDADRTNDIRSLQRKLERKLYFVMKRTESSEHYQFPQRLTADDELLRDSAEKALKAVLGEQQIQTYYTTYSPVAHLEHTYSTEYQKKNQVHGIKIFFYPAELITGEVTKLRHGVDFLWLTAEELKDYISPQYYKAVQDVLVPDPATQKLKTRHHVSRRYRVTQGDEQAHTESEGMH